MPTPDVVIKMKQKQVNNCLSPLVKITTSNASSYPSTVKKAIPWKSIRNPYLKLPIKSLWNSIRTWLEVDTNGGGKTDPV